MFCCAMFDFFDEKKIQSVENLGKFWYSDLGWKVHHRLRVVRGTTP